MSAHVQRTLRGWSGRRRCRWVVRLGGGVGMRRSAVDGAA